MKYHGRVPSQYMLAVVGVRGHTACRLPASGTVTIGRAEDCDVVIDDASVSRRHAELDLGPPITICDLGSSNGSRVRRSKQGSQETAELFDVISISAGMRGLQVLLAPADYIRAVAATVAMIAKFP